MTIKSFALLVVTTLCSNWTHTVCYVPPAIQKQWKETGYNLDQAMKTVDDCAQEGENSKDLYYAVRFIDRHAHKIYHDPQQRAQLFQNAQGSWELRLAYEDSRKQEFFPYPDFRDYAMAFTTIEPDYFGKGIAQNPDFCFVAMGGPSVYNAHTRQLYMQYEDFYISGTAVPEWDLSFFMRGYASRGRPPLAFTLIACSEDALVVRGSKTGGMAIFRRIDQDMREAAYGADRSSGGV